MAARESFGFLSLEQVEATRAAIVNRVLHAARGGRLAIVGSAELPQKCAAAIRKIGCEIPVFVEFDPRYWGREALGIPIVSPSEALQRLPEDALYVCCIWSPNHRFSDTREWLAAHGIHNVLPASAIFWAIPEVIGAHYQLAPPQRLVENVREIEQLFQHFSDRESGRQYIAHLRWRVSLDPSYIPEADSRHVYFDPGLVRLSEDAVVADGGAFDGDSLRRFLFWQGSRFAAYHAFEPDLKSFRRLEQFHSSLNQHLAERIFPRHLAIGAQPGSLRFSDTGKPGSRATEEDGVVVECVRLDEYFGGTRLDYLKLDVEGAEQSALSGAWPLIERDRPVVAVAVYHGPEDIYRLPLSIISRTQRYRYFLRSHDHDGIDLVFYAIPEERSARFGMTSER